ncbi:MAG: VRR-NUC domain-containing protein [Clostridia bacterium]|nr:VRR-NUC domain-containing protein [Clostridia bacterium]
MREKSIENQIKATLTQLGKNVWFFKHAASAAMKVGIPDIVCCIKGRFVGIEVKQANGHQSEAQKVCENNILAAGGEYWLVYSYEDFVNKFNNFVRRLRNGK